MRLRRLEVGPFASNCYVLGDDDSPNGLVIDPGDDADLIIRAIKELGITVKSIVLTHAHIDHVAATAEVKRFTGAPVALHREDVPVLEATSSLFELYSPSLEVDETLRQGDFIRAGKISLAVLHTPGHTPGGICLYGEGVLFTGDTLFAMGIGRTDLPGGDYSLLMDSLRDLMKLPDDTVVYPGHGPETTIGDERNSNPFLRTRF